MKLLAILCLVLVLCAVVIPAKWIENDDVAEDDDIKNEVGEESSEESSGEAEDESESNTTENVEAENPSDESDSSNTQEESPSEESPSEENPSEEAEENVSEENPSSSKDEAAESSEEEGSAQVDTVDANEQPESANAECNLKIKRVGCYKKFNTFPTAIPLEKKIPMKKGHIAKDSSFNELLPQIACDCANAALDKGNAIFSLRNIGECWTGPDSTVYDAGGVSDQCITTDERTCDQDDPICAGNTQSDFVYFVDTPTHTKSAVEYAEELKKAKESKRSPKQHKHKKHHTPKKPKSRKGGKSRRSVMEE